MDYIKLAQRTIAMLSSMIESGECHTTRSKEMKDHALNGLNAVNESNTQTLARLHKLETALQEIKFSNDAINKVLGQ